MTCCQVTTLLCKTVQTLSSGGNNNNNIQLLWIIWLQAYSAPHVFRETSVHPAKDQSSAVSTRDCCMLTGKKSVRIQTLQEREKTFETTMGQVIPGPGTEKSAEGKILTLSNRNYRYISINMKIATPTCCDKFCICSLLTNLKTPATGIFLFFPCLAFILS